MLPYLILAVILVVLVWYTWRASDLFQYWADLMAKKKTKKMLQIINSGIMLKNGLIILSGSLILFFWNASAYVKLVQYKTIDCFYAQYCSDVSLKEELKKDQQYFYLSTTIQILAVILVITTIGIAQTTIQQKTVDHYKAKK